MEKVKCQKWVKKIGAKKGTKKYQKENKVLKCIFDSNFWENHTLRVGFAKKCYQNCILKLRVFFLENFGFERAFFWAFFLH